MSRFLMASLLAVTVAATYAQTTGSATIVGTVSDNTGAVIPAAKITIVSPSMGFSFETPTNADGTILCRICVRARRT